MLQAAPPQYIAAPRHRHCVRRARTSRLQCRTSCSAAGKGSVKRGELLDLWETTCRAPWDSTPRSWEDFWALKLAGAVVESNAQAREVRVTPVRNPGLRVPRSFSEAWTRVQHNVVLFRQNYLLCTLALAFCSALRSATLLAALASAVVAAGVSSDRLLGELALATDNRFVWNEVRVAGLDRSSVRSSAWVCAILCWAAAPSESALWFLRTVVTCATFTALHAVLRPVDLTDAVASFIGELGGVKSRAALGNALQRAAKGVMAWWQEPAEPVPIVVVQRGSEDEVPAPSVGSAPHNQLPHGKR